MVRAVIELAHMLGLVAVAGEPSRPAALWPGP